MIVAQLSAWTSPATSLQRVVAKVGPENRYKTS